MFRPTYGDEILSSEKWQRKLPMSLPVLDKDLPREIWGSNTDLAFLKEACNQQEVRQADKKGQASYHSLLLALKVLGVMSMPRSPCQPLPTCSLLCCF